MPHRRPLRRGSFGSHFDELVVHFPSEGHSKPSDASAGRSQELQDKIDVHRLLFERAWGMEEQP